MGEDMDWIDLVQDRDRSVTLRLYIALEVIHPL